MHDIDRGGSATAVRLAALAALRKAQGEGAFWRTDDTPTPASRGGGSGRGSTAQPAPRDAVLPPLDTAPRLSTDGSASVFTAVEAAVRKSREEFVLRLAEYRKTLDCDLFKSAEATSSDAVFEQAQFIAHRIAGVGKTLGFADLGDAARQAEEAIVAYKLERSSDLRKTSVARICNLARLIEVICADEDNCPA